MRRFLGGGLAALLAAGGALLATGQPASAALTRYVTPTSATFTDSARPTTAFPVTDGNVPVGTWEDADGRHTSRAYFTFDLTPYRNKQIIRAMGMSGETAANDCDRPRVLELWRTDTPAAAPTWQNAPTVREKIGDVAPNAPCRGHLEILLTEAVQQAVDAELDTVTYLARIGGEDLEENKHYGRRIKTLGISIEANGAPDVPTNLRVDGRACADGLLVPTTAPVLAASVTDPDRMESYAGDPVSATFAWWPVDRPTERTEWTVSPMSAPATQVYRMPDGHLAHGGTYAFQVRASDQHANSGWSAECRFTVDTVRPPTPTVSSTDYPSGGDYPGHGGAGLPGTFTFGPNGADDVAGYQWGTAGPSNHVTADATGAATISHAPQRHGPNRIYVRSVDRAGLPSDLVVYEFIVRDTTPRVTDNDPNARLGAPRGFVFAPGMDDVVSYTYRLNDEPEQTVAAGADGSATVTVVPTRTENTLYVTSRTRDSLVSGRAAYPFRVRTEPVVSSAQWPEWEDGAPVGTAGSFRFQPAMDDVTEYVYSFNYGEQRTVAAGPDGTTTIDYTPAAAHGHTLEVFSRTSTGVVSETVTYQFYVTSVAPTVASEVYRRNLTGGGPGVTGSFTFRPHAQVTGVTSYVYTFRGEAEKTVTANADGSATVEWTPQAYDEQNYGWVELRVRARTASGTTTDAAFYSFRVEPYTPTIISEVFGWQGGPVGTTGDFVFTTGLPGATEFVYVFDGGSEQTVPVGPDGTATLTWTAESAYVHELTVRARTATGVLSGSNYYSFWIDG
ncbi:hypothetical protein [Micromonospora pallida]|uniref:hypothetical protein n=1 Tax=Micromonospora pallida TaxID=145854 RepID=UPI000B85519F|nr:hypothetical protein [Micromonospora pallida]